MKKRKETHVWKPWIKKELKKEDKRGKKKNGDNIGMMKKNKLKKDDLKKDGKPFTNFTWKKHF